MQSVFPNRKLRSLPFDTFWFWRNEIRRPSRKILYRVPRLLHHKLFTIHRIVICEGEPYRIRVEVGSSRSPRGRSTYPRGQWDIWRRNFRQVNNRRLERWSFSYRTWSNFSTYVFISSFPALLFIFTLLPNSILFHFTYFPSILSNSSEKMLI